MSVVIDQCRLRGTQDAINRGKRQLQTSWLPSVADPEVVIVRRIATRSALAEMPRRLYREADRLLGARVSGWADSALDADCVYFDSAADLLARLSLDIALDRAADVWFWRSFRRYLDADPSLTFARLWHERSSELPAVFVELDRRGQLHTVWHRVSDDLATRLLPMIAPPVVTALFEEDGAPTSLSAPSTDYAVDSLIATLRVWQPPPASPESMTPRHHLALALALAALRPHWLKSARINLLQQVLRAYRQPPVSADSTAVPSKGPAGHETTVSDMPPAVASVDNPASRSHVKTAVDELPSTEVTVNDSGRQRDGDDTMAARVDVDDATALDETPLAAGDDSEADPWDASMQWRVEQGGLFYLLNLLNLPWTRERLFADAEAMGFPTAWGWLYRLGEAFGLQAEPGLLQCLATLSNMPQQQFPVQLPAFGAAMPILEYGHERYAAFGIWESSLLQQPAQIAYRRPELDIRFRLSELDIRVRRAALDVDPGWIDWLGTRVRFHYQDVL